MNKIFIGMLISTCLVGFAQGMKRTESEEDLQRALAASLAESRELSEEEQVQRAIEQSKLESGEKHERERRLDEEAINQAIGEINLQEQIAKKMQEQVGRTPQGGSIPTPSKEVAWQAFWAKKQAELDRYINK